MKITINSKRYDTSTLDICGHQSHYNNGNPVGESYWGVHEDGTSIIWTDGYGRDIYCQTDIRPAYGADQIDDWDMTDDEEANAIKHGLITLA